MSDDLTTSVIQLSPSGEPKVSTEASAEKTTQDVDFKQIFSDENKKLVAKKSPAEDNEVQKVLSQERQNTPSGSLGEATSGQHLASDLSASGNSLPNLSLHNRALAVGRVIYTADTVDVTNESLSKFMERQGLISNRLQSGSAGKVGNPLEADRSLVDLSVVPLRGLNPLEADRSLVDLSAETQSGSKPLNAEAAEDDPVNGIATPLGSNANADIVVTAPSGSNAITQLAVKQIINSRESTTNDASNTPGRKASAEKIDASGLAIAKDDDSLSPISGKQSDNQSVSSVIVEKDLTEKAIRSTPGAQKDIVRGDLLVQKEVDTGLPGTEPTREMKSFGEETPEIVSKKNQQAGDQNNSSRVQVNRDFELARLEAASNKIQESGNDKPSLNLTSTVDNLEASLKAYRDVSQVSDKDSLNNEAAYNRVEFRGALKEAQRMVVANSYNNLTDSYENWSAKFGEILAQRIAGYVNKENWNIQLRLNPASLGEISLELELNEKGLEGRFGSNEEATKQLLQDTLPKLRLALRDLIDENQALSFDVSEFGNANSGNEDQSEKNASPEIVEEINFESEVLLGRTLDARLSSVVGLDILV